MSRRHAQRSGDKPGGRRRPSRQGAPLPVLRRFRHTAVQAWGRGLALVALLTLSILSGFHTHPAFTGGGRPGIPFERTLTGMAARPAAQDRSVILAPAHDRTAQNDAPDGGGPDDDKACILCQAIQALTAVAPGGAPPMLGPGMVLAGLASAPVGAPPTSARCDGPQQPRAPPALV